MCGIYSTYGSVNKVIDALKHLRYRGADSAGVAAFSQGEFLLYRTTELNLLEERFININQYVPDKRELSKIPILGHTRWASESKVCVENTHPILSHGKKILLAHNGSLANYSFIMDNLEKQLNKNYNGRTDTEVLTDFIDYSQPITGCQLSLQRLINSHFEGTYAIVYLVKGCRDIHFMTQSSPLYYYEGEIGSDSNLFPAYYQIPDNSYGYFYKKDDYSFKLKINNEEVIPSYTTNKQFQSTKTVDLLDNEDLMLKEIKEQATLNYDYFKYGKVYYDKIFDGQLELIGCGSSYNAGLLGKMYFDLNEFGLRACVNYSSEVTHNKSIFSTSKLAITQSGETADTLEVLKEWRKLKRNVVLVTNQENSTCSHLLGKDGVYLLAAGPEKAVAATKTFTSTCLMLLALSNYKLYSNLNLGWFKGEIGRLIQNSGKIQAVAKEFSKFRNALVLGSSFNYPIALEAALKLKEISGLHAEGLPTENFKHGVIALSSSELPGIFLLPNSNETKYARLINNIKQMKARGSPVLGVGPQKEDCFDWYIETPQHNKLLHPLLHIVNMQLFSYFLGKEKGLNVDNPFACAKAITVY